MDSQKKDAEEEQKPQEKPLKKPQEKPLEKSQEKPAQNLESKYSGTTIVILLSSLITILNKNTY